MGRRLGEAQRNQITAMSAATLLRQWIDAHSGALPKLRDWPPASELPCYQTYYNRFPNFHAAVSMALELPSTCGPAPVASATSATVAKVKLCLKCDEPLSYWAPDARLCPLCRKENTRESRETWDNRPVTRVELRRLGLYGLLWDESLMEE